MRPSKSIRYGRDFAIAGLVSTYFTVILLGFQMLFAIIKRGLRYSGVRYHDSGVPLYWPRETKTLNTNFNFLLLLNPDWSIPISGTAIVCKSSR